MIAKSIDGEDVYRKIEQERRTEGREEGEDWAVEEEAEEGRQSNVKVNVSRHGSVDIRIRNGSDDEAPTKQYAPLEVLAAAHRDARLK